MKVMREITAILSTALLFASNAYAVNMVSNGDFEAFTGTFGNVVSGDGGSQINPGENFLTGWDVFNGPIAILQDGNAYNIENTLVSPPNKVLDLTGYSDGGFPKGISQTLSLMSGQQYTFSIQLGVNNGDCGGAFCTGPITVNVSVGGDLFQDFTLDPDITDPANHDNVWQAFQSVFTATSTNPSLQISAVFGDQLIGVDNVSIEAIITAPETGGGDPVPGGTTPEPSSLILFASGLIGLAYWRRKRTV
jgi:hypothetical protein